MEARDIMHPEDVKALRALQSLKGYNELISFCMEHGLERIYRGECLGSFIKVSSMNYPALYIAFKEVVEKVGISEPELYIYNDPRMNAFTYGENNTFVALSSGLVERMELDELRSVIAHECGHILCHHTLYQTLLRTISDLGYWLDILSYATLGPVLMAMQYWSRKCEYSADRCAAAVVGEFSFQKAMLKLSCGLKEISGNPYQLVEQAKEYHHFKKSSWLNRLQQNCRIAFNSHPQHIYRAWEIDRWKNSWQYRKLRSTCC